MRAPMSGWRFARALGKPEIWKDGASHAMPLPSKEKRTVRATLTVATGAQKYYPPNSIGTMLPLFLLGLCRKTRGCNDRAGMRCRRLF